MVSVAFFGCLPPRCHGVSRLSPQYVLRSAPFCQCVRFFGLLSFSFSGAAGYIVFPSVAQLFDACRAFVVGEFELYDCFVVYVFRMSEANMSGFFFVLCFCL